MGYARVVRWNLALKKMLLSLLKHTEIRLKNQGSEVGIVVWHCLEHSHFILESWFKSWLQSFRLDCLLRHTQGGNWWWSLGPCCLLETWVEDWPQLWWRFGRWTPLSLSLWCKIISCNKSFERELTAVHSVCSVILSSLFGENKNKKEKTILPLLIFLQLILIALCPGRRHLIQRMLRFQNYEQNY